MRIKIGTEFLDFSDDIEIERQAKLFEDISSTDGDFSYSFSIERTLNNTRILNNPLPDNINKEVYQKIASKLLNESGEVIYDGYIRIEQVTQKFECSFFSGNNNWFGMLSGNLRDLDWSEFDIDMTEANLSFAIFKTEGLVFPTIDNGLLHLRGFALMKVEDFIGAIYVKTVFNKIFSSHGIKLKGELFNDANYQTAVTLQHSKSQAEIDRFSVFAFTNNAPIPDDNLFYVMQWTDKTTSPYHDESNLLNLSNGRITTSVKMRIEIEVIINTPVAENFFFMLFARNGVPPSTPGDFMSDIITATEAGVSGKVKVELSPGDYLEVWIDSQSGHGNPLIITDATLRVTPIFIYKAFGNSTVPDWTQQKYVSNILKIFNCLTHYDKGSSTLTVDLFEKIKHKEPIDPSEYISETETDYQEFISSYGKKNLLTYQKLEDEDIKEKLIPFSSGEVLADNDFLEDEVDIIESDFTQPISYVNEVFKASIERTKLLTFEQIIQVDITSVADNGSGKARFSVSEDEFELSDMVRITDSSNRVYNGDYMVVSLAPGWVELSGVPFGTDARAKIALMRFNYTDSEDVYLLHNVPLYSVGKFSRLQSIRVENTDYGTLSYGFFNVIDTGLQVSKDFKSSLSFADNDQQGLATQYFRLFKLVLNDPVMIKATAHLPQWLFAQLDFLQPIKIRTIETTNLYYLNRITGYKESDLPCTLELIKI